MNPSRREFLLQSKIIGLQGAIGLFCLPSLFSGGVSTFDPIPTRKKNVLFIAVDDLRPELGCYGHPLIQSPNIDALASTGILFERTYCQQAICGPTRASLLTGRRPDTTRVYDLKTHIRSTMPEVVTLPQHFKNNGYISEGLGKLFHNGLEDEASYSTPHRYPKGSRYALEKNRRLEREGGKQVRNAAATAPRRASATECADVPDEAYGDGNLAQMAIESLRRTATKATATNQGERQPFFLGVGFAKPHLPFCAPKKYWDLYQRDRIPLPYAQRPKNAPDIAFTDWGELRSYSDIPDVGNLDEAKTRELIHGYYACVSYMDAQVGKVMTELDRLHLRKDTIIIIWGDHGWKLGEYSAWSKHTNFELDTHVPMILSDPDFPKGIRVDALTEFVDIYPTLAELCGLTPPGGLEGTSMVPLLSDPKRPWKKAAFSQYPRRNRIMGYSMRTDQYRYTEWVDQKTKEIKERELYDLKNDPLCKESIVSQPENRALVTQLQERMEAGWQSAKP